jgi:puromycin-sensitive aminopeptidase
LTPIDTSRLPRSAIPTHYELEIEPDLKRHAFGGTVAIDLDLVDPSATLALNAADLVIHWARLEHPDGPIVAGEVDVIPDEQRIVVAFSETLRPAAGYRLTMAYSGRLGGQLRGLYRSTFTDEEGHDHVIATTQFEPSDARRAFPCWDEPDFKATFRVRLVVPAGLAALSNSPEETTEDLGGGRRRVTFEKTMPMSTYLVAFVVGPYEINDADHGDGIPVRIAAVRGKSHLTAYAGEVAVHALSFLSRYFDIPYPGKKIDHIAVPDFAFGAMENFGCVTYRENALLADPDRASQAELQRIAAVVAHETAHMWFGDLVTMKWWNGIWLNEAFANFMENTTADAFNPEWDVWASFGNGRAAALTTDGLHASRAIEFVVHRPEEAEAMFDVLTYQKGGSVLRMLEQFLGAETFRKGINDYLRAHSYANTETTDLWDALEEASGFPVRAMMDSWIFKPGHPLVKVSPVPESAAGDIQTIELRQHRFLYDTSGTTTAFGRAAGTELGHAADDEMWKVPVTIRACAGGAVQQHRLVLDGPDATLSFDAPLDWVVVNDGAHGFYRVRYSPALWAKLQTAPASEILTPGERLAMLSDAWAAVMAGLADLPEWTTLVAWLDDDDPDVWASINTTLAHLAGMAAGEERSALDAYITRIVEPVWEHLGWEPGHDEARRRISARARVMSAVALIAGEARLKREACSRFIAHTTGTRTLAPDLVPVAARIYVSAGAEAEWNMVLDLYRQATLPQDKQRYLYALAETNDAALLEHILDMTLSPEVRTQDAPFVVATAMAHPGSGPATWRWVKENWGEVSSRYPSTLLVRALDSIPYLADPAIAADVGDFCRSAGIPSAGPRLDQLLERMAINVSLAGRFAGSLIDALA